mmetsp:Transcript_19539/g.24156  ORF Transcript_19539/g.24156 Transcript_19539/m.24156 type:complete len:117 (-) Transcript_19539:259-609(-)
MGKDWTWSPFSTDGRFNASQAAKQLGVSVRQDKTSKNFKRTFTMTLKRNQKNGISKRKQSSNPAVGVSDIREVNRAAKAIQAVKFVNDNDKKAALRKLARACASTKSQVRGAAKAE